MLMRGRDECGVHRRASTDPSLRLTYLPRNPIERRRYCKPAMDRANVFDAEISGFATILSGLVHRPCVAQHLASLEVTSLTFDFSASQLPVRSLQPLDCRGCERLRAQQLPAQALKRKQIFAGSIEFANSRSGPLRKRRRRGAQRGPKIPNGIRNKRSVAACPTGSAGMFEVGRPRGGLKPAAAIVCHRANLSKLGSNLKFTALNFKLGSGP